MVEFSVGDVVFVNFPFSNLEKSKLRPAVIIASVQNHDWILCQITSKSYSDTRSIELIEATTILTQGANMNVLMAFCIEEHILSFIKFTT